jgi:hypothetical protein
MDYKLFKIKSKHWRCAVLTCIFYCIKLNFRGNSTVNNPV